MAHSTVLNRGVPGFAAKFGSARVDITPPIGIYLRNWGAAKHDKAESVHRPLYLTALTISSINDSAESSPLVLISGDLGWWRSASLFEAMRDRLLEQLKLPKESFWFAMTHSHATVPLQPANPELPGGELLGDYLDLLEKKIIEVVHQALSNTTEGILDWHYGKCLLAKARDLPDPQDADQINCGFNPDAEADETLLVGRVTGRDGRHLATLINYACHPTTLAWENRAISPDFIGAMQETIETATDGALSLFLIGAAGEVSPREQYTADLEIPDRHGRQLGYAVLATLADMHPPSSRYEFDHIEPSGAPLAVWKYKSLAPRTDQQTALQNVPLELKNWPLAEELAAEAEAAPDRFQQERLYRKREIRLYLGDDDQWDLPVWYWQLGETILIGTMTEAYTLFQQELRRKFPDRHIACLNLLNGSIGYLAPEKRYRQNIYQVWQSPFGCGSLERLVESSKDFVQSMIAADSAVK
ncbi:MAG: alkaline ceramidase [Planctomycetaceae bacterium]